VGFYCFYWASQENWTYVSSYEVDVNLSFPDRWLPTSQAGVYSNLYDILTFTMQYGDDVYISYANSIKPNGTLQIVLYGLDMGGQNLTYTPGNELGYNNQVDTSSINVEAAFIAQNPQNLTIPTTIQLRHYQRPQWVYFGFGVFLNSLAVIEIARSKR